MLVRLLKHLDNKRVVLDVQDELRFHIEMLERKYVQQGMPAAEARTAATTRFGNFERVKHQCVKISQRSSPLRRALRFSLILLGFTGFLIHILNSDFMIARIGTVMICIAILGRLLLYVRGLSPATFLPRTNEASISIRRKP